MPDRASRPHQESKAPTTCHFWSQGNCTKGNSCPFLHEYAANDAKLSFDPPALEADAHDGGGAFGRPGSNNTFEYAVAAPESGAFPGFKNSSSIFGQAGNSSDNIFAGVKPSKKFGAAKAGADVATSSGGAEGFGAAGFKRPRSESSSAAGVGDGNGQQEGVIRGSGASQGTGKDGGESISSSIGVTAAGRPSSGQASAAALLPQLLAVTSTNSSSGRSTTVKQTTDGNIASGPHVPSAASTSARSVPVSSKATSGASAGENTGRTGGETGVPSTVLAADSGLSDLEDKIGARVMAASEALAVIKTRRISDNDVSRSSTDADVACIVWLNRAVSHINVAVTA